MITIIVGNSYSTIKGLTAPQEKELKALLSYVVGGSSSYFSGYGPKHRSLLDKKGVFPTGLLHRVTAWLPTKPEISYSSPIVIKGSSKKHSILYPWQETAVRNALYMTRGIITAPTGAGKSRVIEAISAQLGNKVLVIVPSIEIKTQLSAVLNHLKLVRVENIDSTALKTLTDFDCLIIDEGHHAAAKTYRNLNKTAWNAISYRFFITATPFRNDNEETLLFESIAGQVIYKLTYADAVANKYIVPIESYYLQCPKQKTEAFTYREVYNELVINNTPRNVMIANLLTSLHSSQKSTLCLVKEVAHGKILSELTGLPFVSGDDNDSRKYIGRFNSGSLKVLIATTGIMGEGIDSKPCEFVVIAGLGKAKSQFMQQCGRAVRTYPGKESAKVILIKDTSHRFLTRHYNTQRAILKEEYNSIPVKLEI